MLTDTPILLKIVPKEALGYDPFQHAIRTRMIPAKPKENLPEVLAWALLAFLGACAMLVFRPTPIFHDSYQYLNVAEHIKNEHQVATSLIHFDTERSHGRIPAPLTTFPPGYPMLIALTSIGGDFEAAARFLSCVCYAGTAALLAWALILTGVTAFVRQVVLLLYATNAVALMYATTVLSDPLYSLLSTGAVVTLIWAEKSVAPKPVVTARVLMAMSVTGVAYLVRYVGLFLIAGFLGYAVLRLLVPGSRFRGVFLLSTLIPITLATGMMLRNAVTSGTWKGGNEIPVHNPAKRVLADYARAQLQVMLGQHGFALGVWEGLLLAGALGIAGLSIAAAMKGFRPDSGRRNVDSAGLLAALCIAVYTAGLVYTCLTSMIVYETRYLLPMLPLYLLWFGMAIHWLTSRCSANPAVGRIPAWLAILLALVGYAGVNARGFPRHPGPSPQKTLAAEFAEPDGEGHPLRNWVDSHIPASEAIVAADGQAIGYLLHRPTVSMISAAHSRVRWDCDEVKNEMRRFRANFVILPKTSPSLEEDLLLSESRFVAASLSSQPPCGFVVAAENAHIRILTPAGRD